VAGARVVRRPPEATGETAQARRSSRGSRAANGGRLWPVLNGAARNRGGALSEARLRAESKAPGAAASARRLRSSGKRRAEDSVTPGSGGGAEWGRRTSAFAGPHPAPPAPSEGLRSSSVEKVSALPNLTLTVAEACFP